MIKFFDSHIHLHTDSISGWENQKDWIFNNVSITLQDFYKCLEQSKNHANVFVTAGIHPLEIDSEDIDKTIKILDKEIQNNRSRIIAVGETGFDFYKTIKEESFENQKQWLLAHYELAKKHNLPLMLHIRRAHPEALEVLEGLCDCRGIIHSFDASEDIAKRYLNLKGDWMLSISPVMFRDNSEVRKYIGNIDINRLLVESDAPFLGKSYEDVKNIVKVIAEVKNLEFDVCKEILWNNFCRFFKFKDI